MNDWSSVRRFCDYLEHASVELTDRITETQNEVTKLQDILDTVSPVPVSEPKEEVRVANIQQNRKVFRGFDHKMAPKQVATSMDTFEEFKDLLDQYSAVKKTVRGPLSDRFVKRVLDFSRTTAAHMHERLPVCTKRLVQELDKILDYDMDQLNLKYRAKYTTDKAAIVVAEFDRMVEEFGLRRRVDVMTRELTMEEKVRMKLPDLSTQFEILANFTPKQLNSFYRLRGNARRSLMAATIKEKAEAAFLPFLETAAVGSEDDASDNISVLRAAQRAFMIVAHDARAYATVVAP